MYQSLYLKQWWMKAYLKIIVQLQQHWIITVNKENLRKLLRNSRSVTVNFTKRDGSVRIMNCTLHPDIVPIVYGSVYADDEGEHIVVWDNEKEDWRMLNTNCEVLNETAS